MSGKKIFPLLLLFSLLAGVIMTWHALSQPGIKDLKGNFKEAALYRNENNTGPVTRIYAVSVKDTLWEEMLQYGEFMPHTKYGTTRVYFFQEGSPIPNQLQPGTENFPSHYQAYCLAMYEKSAMGGVRLLRNPFSL